MKVEIEATERPELLKENLEKRAEDIEVKEGRIVADIDPDTVAKTPGVSSYKVNGERKEGLKGRPVDEEIYARIESREDAVKALLATIDGYDLRVLNSPRSWDLKRLREYNPDIKHLRFDSPRDFLEINRSLQDLSGTEKVDIEIDDEEVDEVYREMLA